MVQSESPAQVRRTIGCTRGGLACGLEWMITRPARVIRNVELSREARHLVVLRPLGWLGGISSVVASVPRTFSLADAGQAG